MIDEDDQSGEPYVDFIPSASGSHTTQNTFDLVVPIQNGELLDEKGFARRVPPGCKRQRVLEPGQTLALSSPSGLADQVVKAGSESSGRWSGLRSEPLPAPCGCEPMLDWLREHGQRLPNPLVADHLGLTRCRSPQPFGDNSG